jgi:CxxC-x17-CxxC domain-containing protein
LFFFSFESCEARRGVSNGMSDKTLTCRDCGETFTFTAGEQAFYLERGFSEPQRCPACRTARKAQRQSSGGYDSGGYGGGGGGGYSGGGGGGGYSSGPRQMYPATCSNCGQATEVPFMPRSDKPVFCRECFAERRSAAPRGYGNY